MDDNDTIEPAKGDPIIEMVTDVVSAYVLHNSVPASGLAELIATTHAALTDLSRPAAPAEPQTEKPTPAQIRKSITPDALISFIDGKGYKTLKRHLTRHGLDPASYKAKFGLPSDYPTTAASYSASRSALAKQLGLGSGRRQAAELDEVIAKPVEEIPEPTQKPARGRKKAASE